MSFLEQITADLATAMRARDERAVATLRLVKAALTNEQIAQGGTLQESTALAVLAKEAKRRKEAMALYATAGRTEAGAQEEAELAIIEHYLPAQASPEEVRHALQTLLESGTPLQKGALMAALRSKLPAFDGATAASIIDEYIAAG